MSKAADPFEEYLLKRKVEILEEKFRKQTETPDVEDEEGKDGVPHAQEDPEVAARLKEEMEEFFDAGQSSGPRKEILGWKSIFTGNRYYLI